MNDHPDTPTPAAPEGQSAQSEPTNPLLRARLRVEDLDRDEIETLIVRSVLAGRKPATPLVRNYQAIARPLLSDSSCALAIRRSLVPDQVNPEMGFLLASHCTPERIRAIEDGAPPTRVEHAAWRAAWLERSYCDGDADAIAAVCVTGLLSLEGGRCVALATIKGYSFSGITIDWYGFFVNKDEALSALRQSHYLSCDPLPRAPVLCCPPDGIPDPPGSDGGQAASPARQGRGPANRARRVLHLVDTPLTPTPRRTP